MLLARLDRLRSWRADLVALSLGVLSAAALPPCHLIPVLLISMPGTVHLTNASRGPGVAFRRGWWFGFGHHLIGLYWITEAILIEAARFWWFIPLAVPSLSALLALFIAAPFAVARLACPGWRQALTLAGAWTLADIAREFVFTGFPWNPWGSIWTVPGFAGDVMIQPAAWIGVSGLTFATVLLAVIPTMGRRAWAAGAVLFAVWVGGGIGRLSEPQPSPQGVSVILVQGNVAQGQKWDRGLMDTIFNRYLRLTASGVEAAKPGARVVVWPETASPFLLETDAGAREAIAEAAHGASILAGTVRFDAAGHPLNALAAITPKGGLVGLYAKWHLVPFGEFQPSWFPLPIQVVPGGGFARGSGPKTLRLPGLPSVGPMICYEAVYSGELVDRRDRPDWLVNVTNDAWFGNSSGPRQHLAAARLRAVEEGLPLMRAANTGITVGFDAFGRELGRLGMGEPGFLVLSLPGAVIAPPFARAGLSIPLGIAIVAALAGLPPISARFRRGSERSVIISQTGRKR